ncbi:hypothetical protein Dimus_013130 [Dionaea muscipula]
MDLIYMDHFTSRRLVNLSRVMMRHMSYVISMKDHELPYGDRLTMVFKAFGVPLIDKQGSGENRRRDDEEGESGSDDQLYDAHVEVEEPIAEAPAVPVFPASPGDSSNQSKEKEAVGVDPSSPTESILDSVFVSLLAEFERARANRIQADLEKAQAENVRLLALLQQAQSKPKP